MTLASRQQRCVFPSARVCVMMKQSCTGGSCDDEQAGQSGPTHADCVWPFGFRFCTLFGLSFGGDLMKGPWKLEPKTVSWHRKKPGSGAAWTGVSGSERLLAAMLICESLAGCDYR